MASGRVNAHAVRGAVLITVDAATARDLAEAFSAAYATCADLEAERPWWFDDVTTLLTAAARADIQTGQAPVPVEVPLIRSFKPDLQLVPGGDPA